MAYKYLKYVSTVLDNTKHLRYSSYLLSPTFLSQMLVQTREPNNIHSSVQWDEILSSWIKGANCRDKNDKTIQK